MSTEQIQAHVPVEEQNLISLDVSYEGTSVVQVFKFTFQPKLNK